MQGCTAQGGGARIMTNEETEDQDLEARMGAATEAIRETVLRLLRVGEVHPQLIVLAVAQVTGELAASAVLAGGQEVELAAGRAGRGRAPRRPGASADASGRDAAGGRQRLILGPGPSRTTAASDDRDPPRPVRLAPALPAPSLRAGRSTRAARRQDRLAGSSARANA